TSPGTQGWVAVIPPGATETPGAGSVNLNTTANPSLYAGYGRTDIPLDRATGYTINFSAQIPSSPTIASADKNGDGLPDRAGFSVIAVSSDLRAIELGFLATGIFAQEDGTRQSNPSQQASDPGSLTSTLFTQGESVNYATSTSTNYSLTVQGSTYTLAANGDVILTGNLRDYRATTTSFPTPNPYIVPNTIFFGDDTTSASASVNLGSVTINRNAPVSASGLEDTPIAIPPLALTDLDGVGNITVTLTAAQGNITVNPSIVGGVLVSNITNNGTGTVTLTGNLSQLNATLTGNGLSYQGNLNVNNSDTLTLTVNDGSGAANASASKTVAITIAPVNDAPSFTPGANQTVNAGAGAQTIANFASFNPGAANEAEQTATYTIVSNSNPSLFSGQPTINPDGTLTYTPVASLSSSQSATITVQVQDNGGTLNGGIDTSTIQEFTITVNPIDTPPVIPPPVTPPVTPPVIPPVAPPVAPPVNPPAPPVTPPVTPLTRTTANDFDGDGIADLLITRANFPIKGLQPTTNTYSLILSSTDTFASITTLTSNFQLVATTDFNGDGNTDLLWRNTANNTYSTWFLSGNTYIGGGIIASVSSNFEVVSSADFNGDGKADLIWKNTANNTYSTWLLSSNTYIGGGTIASLSSNFELLGTGDYNGDGRADLLWRDSSSNTYSNWLLNGNTYIGGGTIAALSSNFEIAFSADYNGDGCDDILWRDGNSNSYSNWFLNGSTYIGGGTIATLPVNFEVVSSRDYNGDGCADLVWLNRSNGALSEWFLNGFTYLDGDEVGTLGANEEVRR
ncbi:MAG TPA: FG-GAP-like repeat-containing protein, partial [Thermosynechococcaceae cyanobacterium]